VRVSDINGPRGGADKCCQIQVILSHVPNVIIKDTETDLYVAIDRAADRAGRTVGRRLARQRIKGRGATPRADRIYEPANQNSLAASGEMPT
ncbi:MAG: hypothetical protein ACE5ET_06285, partial [Gammaproteobacteria bacterium]